jgi:hypothetical protein
MGAVSAQPIAAPPAPLTTPGALLDALETQGVRAGLRDGRLRLDAPQGVLTPAIRAAVTAQQMALVALVALVQPPSPPPAPTPAREPGRPTRPCYICRTNRWWQRPDGGWVCAACHPCPTRRGRASRSIETVAAA